MLRHKFLFLMLIPLVSTLALGTARAAVTCVTQEFDGVTYLNCSNGFTGVGSDLGGVRIYGFSNGNRAVSHTLNGVGYIVADGGPSATAVDSGGTTLYGFDSGASGILQSSVNAQVFTASNGAGAVTYSPHDFIITRVKPPPRKRVILGAIQ